MGVEAPPRARRGAYPTPQNLHTAIKTPFLGAASHIVWLHAARGNLGQFFEPQLRPSSVFCCIWSSRPWQWNCVAGDL